MIRSGRQETCIDVQERSDWRTNALRWDSNHHGADLVDAPFQRKLRSLADHRLLADRFVSLNPVNVIRNRRMHLQSSIPCLNVFKATRRDRYSEIEAKQTTSPEELLQLDDSLRRLDRFDQQVAELVRRRLYAGLSVTDAADVMGISRTAAYEHWDDARSWFALEFEAN